MHRQLTLQLFKGMLTQFVDIYVHFHSIYSCKNSCQNAKHNQIVYHLHCQLFHQWSAVMDTWQHMFAHRLYNMFIKAVVNDHTTLCLKKPDHYD